jgi:CRISPR-associated protein Csd1
MILQETAAQGKQENIPPLLAGELIRAILTGRPYPKLLLSALISRIRADRRLGYIRAAMLKAYLVRQRRLNQDYRHNPNSMEVNVSLDIENKNPAYLLGRLFAVLENLQSAALPGIKATIRDKYFASASSAPRASFPYLLRNAQNHFAKLRKQEEKRGLAGYFDNTIGKIMEGLEADTGFPTTLSMEEQGLFFLGYYHQQAYRPNKQDDSKTPAPEAAENQED